MKRSLPCVFLALTIFNLNALPAQAVWQEQKSQKVFNLLTKNPGLGCFCFEIPLMGIFCV